MKERASRLPPFKAIEAFVVVAQALSFTQAAAMLYITVPAISRRIQALEVELGVKLFQRMHHTVALTEAGAAYAARVAPALKQIREAGEVIRPTLRRRLMLKINMPRSFAAHWLLPRLPRFREKHPDIEVELDTATNVVRLDWHDFDLVIGFGKQEDWQGFHCERLVDCIIRPVGSPALLEEVGPLRADTMERHVFLNCTQFPDMWPEWLGSAGIGDQAMPRRTLMFDDPELLYEAAAGGLGIAVGIDTFVQRYLQDGRLMMAHHHGAASSRSFFLVARATDLTRPPILAFRRWLLAEAARKVPCMQSLPDPG
jgi:LysR family transcriptional regulator, glycine cleavage system transcriptional activator